MEARMEARPEPAGQPMSDRIRSHFRWIVVAVIVAAIGITLVVAVNDDGGSEGSAGLAGGAPTAATKADLQALAASVGHPVYWVGQDPEATYEVTHSVDGSIYIRYLTASAQIGDPNPDFLTVGTYPVENAYSALEAVAAEDGAKSSESATGALVVQTASRPGSVYVTFPDAGYQIEVYSPDAERAFELAKSSSLKTLG